jgi:hypothetical protein
MSAFRVSSLASEAVSDATETLKGQRRGLRTQMGRVAPDRLSCGHHVDVLFYRSQARHGNHRQLATDKVRGLLLNESVLSFNNDRPN